MKSLSQSERWRLLSAFVDGELSVRDYRLVEELIARDPEAAREVEELRAMKALLGRKEGVPERLGFWTRLSAALDERDRERQNLLPFPRRYLPLVSAVSTGVLVVAGIVFYQQRGEVARYVSEQSEQVQRLVEDNLLKGSFLPLFSGVDRNDVLQFALFGTLPLDAKAETALRVDETTEEGYRIDVERKPAAPAVAVTVADFYEEIGPTRTQMRAIDSLLDIGRKQIAASVFMAEDRAMAIDPQIVQLNRSMLEGIVSSLDAPRRVRFERFLERRNAPYRIAGAGEIPAERLPRGLPKPPERGEFIVVSPETLMLSWLDLDADSIRRTYELGHRAQPAVEMHMDHLMRRFAEREAALKKRVAIEFDQFRLHGGPDFISIEIGGDWRGARASRSETWVRPRARAVDVGHPRMPRSPFDFRLYGEGDSVFYFDLQVDSVVMRIRKDGPEAAFEFFKTDPRMRQAARRSSRMTQGEIDSIAQVLEERQFDLDSLMREFEKRMERRFDGTTRKRVRPFDDK